MRKRKALLRHKVHINQELIKKIAYKKLLEKEVELVTRIEFWKTDIGEESDASTTSTCTADSDDTVML